MSFVDWLFGRKPAATKGSKGHAHSQPASSPASNLATSQSLSHSLNHPHAGASPVSTRREMLRVVLRDTLNRHGIPTAWITADMLVATSRAKEPGIHWRLSVKHWDPRLLNHTVALQNNLIKRVMSFDPLATNWLMGISWQLALEDESECPPMPHPGIWTSDAHAPIVAAAAPEVAGGVIEGPVVIASKAPDPQADSAANAKEDLERLFKIRDEDLLRNGGADGPRHTFAATEPAKL
ncbi:MAG: hypothetical protein ACAH21_12725 [Ramlibacter sp.]|nr:hypothetical protein [Ramlibacter sp.]